MIKTIRLLNAYFVEKVTGRVISEYGDILTRIERVGEPYMRDFRSNVSSLIGNGRERQNLHTVLDSLLQTKCLNFGRLAIMITFVESCLDYCIETDRVELGYQIIDTVATFLEKRQIKRWIEEHGGWTSWLSLTGNRVGK